jgi:cytochrome c biogenesis protein CcmG/thiol:disulfide interchange protein DsbE
VTGVLPGATDASPDGPAAVPGGGPRRRRLVMWVAAGVAVVLAVLIAVLATSGQTGQLSSQSPLLGQMAPPIGGPELLSAPGEPPTAGLQGAPGHWVLVNFAASWCVPCQQEMPQLLTFAARHQGAGAPQIITVAYDEGDKASLAAYFRSRHVTWPLIDDNAAKVAYGVTGIPESYLVDPEGRVVEKITSGVNADQLDAFINRYSPAGTGG